MANSLSVTRLNAGYGAVRVIENISLSVSHAETVVLLGTNGNGKSTLMKCIMGMVRPSAGTIVAEIDGEKYDLVGRSTEEIVALLVRLNEQGITVILIEHIMRAVMSFSQRLVVLVSGRKIADGKPDAVVNDPEVVRAYIGQ